MNIFEIEQNLQEIFDEIEENGGEVTPETLEVLEIHQDEFNQKVQSYVEVIKRLKSDVNLIKEEEARLKTLKQSKEKLQDKLSKIIIDAIERFGDTSKSGAKFVDYGTGKVSIRKSESIITNDGYIEELNTTVAAIFRDMQKNKQLYVENHIDTSTVNDVIKTNWINGGADIEWVDNVDVSDEDLEDITTSVTFKAKLSDLMNERFGIVADILSTIGTIDMKSSVNKTEIKPVLKSGKESAVAAIIINKNLSIK